MLGLLLCWLCMLTAQFGVGHATPDIRLGFGSCNRNDKEPIWHVMSSLAPDKLILLGDNMYADKKVRNFKFKQALPATFIKEYEKLGSDEDFIALVESMGGMDSVYATYDDHDFGINNGDHTYIFRNESMQAFKDFFSNSSYGNGSGKTGATVSSTLGGADTRYSKKDGVYSSSILEVPLKSCGVGASVSAPSVARVKIILLDVRYNRVSSSSESKCSILGEKQWDWLKQELDSSVHTGGNTGDWECTAADADTCSEPPVDLILVGSGTQILPQGKIIEETWHKDCAPERERLLGMLSDTVASSLGGAPAVAGSDHINVMLLSGDVHGAEVAQAFCDVDGGGRANAYNLFEFTSSGFTHTFTHETYGRRGSSVTGTDNQPDASRPGDTKGQIHSRGLLSEVLYSLYRAATPQHYMEDRVADHSHIPHLGILDLTCREEQAHTNTQTPTNTNTQTATSDVSVSPRRYKQLDMHMRIISHDNHTVVDRRVFTGDLLHSTTGEGSDVVGQGKTPHFAQNWDKSNACTLYWGDVPLYKDIGVRALTAFFLMLFLVIPALAVLWFVGASIYYIYAGAELNRRNRILDRNDKINYAKRMGHPIPDSVKEE